MQKNHDDHANTVDRAKYDGDLGETHRIPATEGRIPAGDRSQSRTDRPVLAPLDVIVRRLHALRTVSDETLHAEVTGRGACMAPLPDGDPPPDLFDGRATERESAALLCAGCPVIDACTEWELRLHGADTVGVWGGLSENDRRALHVLWQHDRSQAGGTAGTTGGDR